MQRFEFVMEGDAGEEGQVKELVRYPFRVDMEEREITDLARLLGRFVSHWIRNGSERGFEVEPDLATKRYKIPEALVFDLGDMLAGLIEQMERDEDERERERPGYLGSLNLRAEKLVLERFKQWEAQFLGGSVPDLLQKEKP